MNAFLPRFLLLSALPFAAAYGQPTDLPAAERASLDLRLHIMPSCTARDAQGRCLPIQQRDTPERPAPEQVRALTPPAADGVDARTFTTTAY